MTPDERPRPPSGAPPEACALAGCAEPVLRHLSMTEARKAFPDLPEAGRSAPLCRAHYKEWKKRTKESRTLDRLGR
ncbi:MAG TPA: hypothetical protein VGS23_03685 [Thermoplasmata archaeon]|nr:hypothetical protein [Thermoplasmata archaeon]